MIPRYRNIYASDLDPNRMQTLVEKLPLLWGLLQQKLGAFLRFLEGIANSDESSVIYPDGWFIYAGAAHRIFLRTYSFLAAILPYNNTRCKKRSIFLNFLILKLPAPQEEDLARGILADADAEIEPAPTVDGGHKSEPVLDRSSNVVKAFNEQVGTNCSDIDRVSRRILEDTVPQVAADNAFQNAARHSDRQNARIEHHIALGHVMLGLLKDDTELFKQFSDNASFRRWLTDMVFGMVYGGGEKAA